ncbi:MAG: DedA family protein [Victivallales bacterium]
MTEFLIQYIELAARHAHIWGFVMIFVLMAIESSVFPLPSEVVMIPAGFLAYRNGLTFGDPLIDCSIAVICGALGSLAGAYFNYFMALWLGRPFLYKFGRYFFLPPKNLERCEQVFREYGEVTTFVCRLIPAIRHLISLPAGLSRMSHFRFSFFTVLGAGIWCAILLAIGYYLGSLSADMTYRDLVHRGIRILHENYIWLFLGIAIIIGTYAMIHHMVMKSSRNRNMPEQA